MPKIRIRIRIRQWNYNISNLHKVRLHCYRLNPLSSTFGAAVIIKTVGHFHLRRRRHFSLSLSLSLSPSLTHFLRRQLPHQSRPPPSAPITPNEGGAKYSLHQMLPWRRLRHAERARCGEGMPVRRGGVGEVRRRRGVARVAF